MELASIVGEVEESQVDLLVCNYRNRETRSRSNYNNRETNSEIQLYIIRMNLDSVLRCLAECVVLKSNNLCEDCTFSTLTSFNLNERCGAISAFSS